MRRHAWPNPGSHPRPHPGALPGAHALPYPRSDADSAAGPDIPTDTRAYHRADQRYVYAHPSANAGADVRWCVERGWLEFCVFRGWGSS